MIWDIAVFTQVFSCADIHAAVDLSRICAHNFAAQALSKCHAARVCPHAVGPTIAIAGCLSVISGFVRTENICYFAQKLPNAEEVVVFVVRSYVEPCRIVVVYIPFAHVAEAECWTIVLDFV